MTRFSDSEIAAVYRAIAERRDMRHFRSDPVAPELLVRLIAAAHQAPSVGFMQPWRFIRIVNPLLRQAIYTLSAEEQTKTAQACGERAAMVRRLKLEGIRECGELLVAVLIPDRERYVLGRRTLPEMDICSVACAIQNLWLAARAEGLGMGWVSLFDPDALARLLALPNGTKPLAVLCLGHVDRFYPEPMLQSAGWDERRDLKTILFEDQWGCEPI
ncbi:MAG: 5,6-dimethylbenzimidazole synthase [Alphaproteobacteria bacterium]|nr:5,6-dimethylbenzimidazole synthase [Alphaproteobacteria bacterium]MBU6471639.1 5,6-dimethylbenzimidazole synthase [Alphaproteobacteria bacterium]MDE2494640.1 5,6-dimethylbenzimidazole synthase [Alphaproteobacteria bacterium]